MRHKIKKKEAEVKKNMILDNCLVIFSEALFFDLSSKNYFILNFNDDSDEKDKCTCTLDKQGNMVLARDPPDALLFWKCGVLFLCRKQFPCAKCFFEKALIQNPKAFLYQVSLILAQILQNSSNESDKNCHDWRQVLRLAHNAYDSEIRGEDHQWSYLIEALDLVSRFKLGNSQAKSKLDNKPKKGSDVDRNRFTHLVLKDSLSENKSLDKLYLTFFCIYEILLLIHDHKFIEDIIKDLEILNCFEKIKDNNENNIENDKLDKCIIKIILDKIIAKGEININNLEKKAVLVYIEPHTDWILGEAYIELALKISDSEKLIANKIFRTALNKLDSYDMEPGDRGLISQIAWSHSKIRQNRTALIRGWQAHWIDPTNSYEHTILGFCQSIITDYKNAQCSWSDAELWIPKVRLEISADIAKAYISHANDHTHDSSINMDDLQTISQKKMFESLEKTLELAEYEFQKKVANQYREPKKDHNDIPHDDSASAGIPRPVQPKKDPDDIPLDDSASAGIPRPVQPKKDPDDILLDTILLIHFWIGKIYLEQANYAEAIEKFRIVKNTVNDQYPGDTYKPTIVLPAENSDSDRFLIASYYLGKTLLAYGKIAEAEKEFRSILEVKFSKNGETNNPNRFIKIQDLIDLDLNGKKYSEKFGSILEISEFSVIDILFDTYMNLAKISILRFCNLKETSKYFCGAVNSMGELPDNTDETKKNEYLSKIEKIRGLACINICKNHEKALYHLKKSICMSADPEAYVFLLFTLHNQIKISNEPDKKPEYPVELINCYSLLKKIGIPREYNDEVSRINEDITIWSASSQQGQ